MSYKIAVASSDGQIVDLSFGECEEFSIYEVYEDNTYKLVEKRICQNAVPKGEDVPAVPSSGCGCKGGGQGCSTVHGQKIEELSDCICILCIRAGEKVKQLFGKRAVSLFEISGEIPPLIEKVVSYYGRKKKSYI